ncbi:hypothetical protein GCM10022393_02110 [Aquimarina addita]|uniref:Uncharacterized protein n=1 Tax=Aquimarina addita TaxID=870485 RepID=A0ABP7X890_9FLAO
MFKKLFIGMLAVGLIATSCSDDDDSTSSVTVNAGVIAGGPFEFDVDGEPDMVSGITLDNSDVFGTNSTWVITDDAGNILGAPPTLDALEMVDFDGAGAGTCFIWYARFEDDSNLGTATTVAEITGSFDLSNSIEVIRNQVTNAGSISGGPFEFDVDGESDMVSGIVLDDTNAFGTNSIWVITDDAGNILGAPPTLDAVEMVDFDAAGAGSCFIWYARFEDDSNLGTATTVAEITGSFDLSNSIEVVRNQVTNAGSISGGPFIFDVEGTPDMVSGIVLDNTNVFGTNSTWVITDDAGNILGAPPTLDALEMVDFDGAGVGSCFIWYARFEDDSNLGTATTVAEITGSFDLSNSIEVVRNCGANAGTITGGPFEFTAGDSTPDMVSGIFLDSSASAGTKSTWVITDADGLILGLPETLAMVEAQDFDGAGVGVCLIWYLRYEEGLIGLETMANANDLEGCFSLSNSISVTRN